MEVPKEHLLVQEEMMMPILPVVRVCDVDTAIEYARQAEHGNRHTAMMHSRNVEKLSKMAKIMETTIFVKNAPSYAGIGVGEKVIPPSLLPDLPERDLPPPGHFAGSANVL